MPQNNTSNTSAGLWMSLAATRILLGFIFLWAFLDKLLGLGFSTPSEGAWVNGGSPTAGYLSNLMGVFSPFFASIAGNPLVDWLFMLGLLGVGVGLILGIAMRVSILSGAVMLYLMWLTVLPLSTNPLVDDHIIYIAVLAVLWFSTSLQRFSMGHVWRVLPVVKKHRWLR